MLKLFLTLALFGLFPFFLFIGIIQFLARIRETNAIVEFFDVLKDMWKPRYRGYRRY